MTSTPNPLPTVENDAAAYAHGINVNIGGSGKRPIVTLWCMDCLVTVREFDQVNPWIEVQHAVTEHCSQPSERERLTRPIPPGESNPSGGAE